MTLEENKALVRRTGEEVLNEKKLDVIDEIFHPDFIELDPAPGQEQGAVGIKRWFGKILDAFPDMHWTIEEQVAEADRVMTRWVWQGTHKAELYGIPATGRLLTVSAWTSDHIVDGKIIDSRIIMDMLGMLQQMGIMT